MDSVKIDAAKQEQFHLLLIPIFLSKPGASISQNAMQPPTVMCYASSSWEAVATIKRDAFREVP